MLQYRLVSRSLKSALQNGKSIWRSQSPSFLIKSAASTSIHTAHCLSQSPTPDKRTTALTVITDLKHLRHSPAPALVFGLSGLIPFAAAPAYMITSQSFCPDIAFAQLAYGASILSFLGGVRWGATLPHGSNLTPDWFNLGYSVTPSLIAWVGLLLPYPASMLTVMSGLAGAAYMDLTMTGYPSWFKALRFLLTFVAVLSLWTTFTCKYLIKDSPKSVSPAPTEEAKNE